VNYSFKPTLIRVLVGFGLAESVDSCKVTVSECWWIIKIKY